MLISVALVALVTARHGENRNRVTMRLDVSSGDLGSAVSDLRRDPYGPLDPGPSGTLPIPGEPTFGPFPDDMDGDGEISGMGDEAFPDYIAVLLDDGDSVGYIETEMWKKGAPTIDPAGLDEPKFGEVISSVSIPVYDRSGNIIDQFQLETTFGEAPKE